MSGANNTWQHGHSFKPCDLCNFSSPCLAVFANLVKPHHNCKRCKHRFASLAVVKLARFARLAISAGRAVIASPADLVKLCRIFKLCKAWNPWKPCSPCKLRDLCKTGSFCNYCNPCEPRNLCKAQACNPCKTHNPCKSNLFGLPAILANLIKTIFAIRARPASLPNLVKPSDHFKPCELFCPGEPHIPCTPLLFNWFAGEKALFLQSI